MKKTKEQREADKQLLLEIIEMLGKSATEDNVVKVFRFVRKKQREVVDMFGDKGILRYFEIEGVIDER